MVALAVALAGGSAPLVVPWRIAVQLAGLVVVIGGLGLGVPVLPGGPLGLLAIAAVLGAAAATINNLPASVWAGALLAAPTAYAASIGLAIGPLATPQGSVATLIAADLAGEAAPALPLRWFVPITAAALLCATLLSSSGLVSTTIEVSPPRADAGARRRRTHLASRRDHTRSKRSRFITFPHAATKSWTNFGCASAQA